MKNIAVIGAGAMGNGIAHVFAQAGFKVQLIDTNQTALTTAIATISKNLERLVAKAQIEDSQKTQTLENISTFTSISEGVEYASLVIEAATENVDLKLEIFKQLDMACPEDTILATNTSSISITQLAAQTSRPDQVIGMHFMNPVPVMQLVEIITGYNTSNSVLDFIVNLSKKINKTAVVVKDYPGFVANRILMPMLNEAFETLYTGVAGVKEIDKVMKLGMRHPMGPLELADFIGLDVCLSILEVMHEGFKNPKYAPNPLLVNMVRAGKYGVKTREGFYVYSKDRKAVNVASQFS
jgi:3-hydroxybutyryl-CoA dehydrogenase